MQFTPSEAKMLERLQKQERAWPRRRWLAICTGLGIIAPYLYISQRLFDLLDSTVLDKADIALLFALFWPKTVVMLMFAGGIIGFTLANWRGRPERMLLLKLIEDHPSEASTNTDTSRPSV